MRASPARGLNFEVIEMGLFDFGASSSKSKSESQSSGFDVGFNRSFSDSISGGQSESGSRSTSSQQIAFGDIFQNLFGGASAAASGIDPSRISGAANLLFNAGGSFLEQLGGGAGQDFLKDRLASSDGLADEQIGLLGADIEKFLTESINPAIASKGVAAGTLGGSRGEVARGIAAEGALREFQSGAVGIRQREQQQRDALAGQLGQLEQQGATAGLASLPGLLGLAETGALSSLSPFAALSQIVGGPVALTESESSSFGQSSEFARAIAEAFGLDVGGSQSTSSSKSSSKSFSLGFD